MADSKITALASIGTGADPANDPLVIVDVSDTSMAASGTTKKVTLNNLLASGPAATLASVTVTGAATVGTTLGVTGAATFTGAVVCNGAVTLGDAVGDAVTATGSFTSYTGQNPSAIRAAASDYAAVAFDGATASTRISSTLTGQAIGTGDFSIWCRFKISQATAKAVFSVVEDANNYFGLTTSSGAYGLDKTIGGVASNATITGFTGAAFAGQIVDFVLVRSAGVFSVYVNGSAYTLTNTTGNISLSAAANLRVGGYFTASQVFDKRVYRSVVFNRALSAGDVTELITIGVNPADQWGTQTGQTSGTLVASKRYRITTYVSSDSFTNVGAASNATGVEFVATGTTPTTWTNASTLNRIGGLVDLDFTVGTGYQATDRSTNALHGTLFNGVEFTQPKRVAVLYATTAASGNTQILGSLAIPTNAVIEDVIVNSTGSSTVSVGNVSAGTQIVNGASVVSGRQKLTIATPFSTTGNLWVNSSAAVTLQFTILYTIAA
jgi:hypothetical protein